MKVHLFNLDTYHLADGHIHRWYLATAPGYRSFTSDTPASIAWLPLVAQWASVATMAAGGTRGSGVQVDDLRLINVRDGVTLPRYANVYDVTDAVWLRVALGERPLNVLLSDYIVQKFVELEVETDQPYSTATVVWQGKAGIVAQSRTEIRVPIYDRMLDFDEAVQLDRYLGTGGVEGPAELKDVSKERSLGWIPICTPTYLGIIGGKHTYSCNGGRPIEGIVRGWDRGAVLTLVVGVPASGQFSVDVATGILTIGGSKPDDFRVEVKGDKPGGVWNSKIADIVAHLAVEAGLMAPSVTYSRTGVATYVNSEGDIATAASGAARFDHDPVTGEAKGLLIEEARTNLLWPSSDFTHANWVKTATVTADQVVAPDGTLSGDLLNATATDQIVQAIAAVTNNATGNTFSVFLKAGTAARTSLRLEYFGGTNVSYLATITWATLTITDNFGTLAAAPTLTAVGNGWYRAILTANNNNTGNTSASCRILPGGSSAYSGSTGTVYAWLAQAEPGAFATSPIPTTTATVTRAADVCSLALSSVRGWDATQGTVVFTGRVGQAPPAAAQDLFCLDDGTTNNRIEAFSWDTAPTIFGRVITGGVVQASLVNGAQVLTADTEFSYALAFAANDFAGSLNGATPLTDAAGSLPSVTTLRLGANSVASYLNGHIRRIRLFSRRLSNAELQSVTSSDAQPSGCIFDIDFVSTPSLDGGIDVASASAMNVSATYSVGLYLPAGGTDSHRTVNDRLVGSVARGSWYVNLLDKLVISRMPRAEDVTPTTSYRQAAGETPGLVPTSGPTVTPAKQVIVRFAENTSPSNQTAGVATEDIVALWTTQWRESASATDADIVAAWGASAKVEYVETALTVAADAATEAIEWLAEKAYPPQSYDLKVRDGAPGLWLGGGATVTDSIAGFETGGPVVIMGRTNRDRGGGATLYVEG